MNLPSTIRPFCRFSQVPRRCALIAPPTPATANKDSRIVRELVEYNTRRLDLAWPGGPCCDSGEGACLRSPPRRADCGDGALGRSDSLRFSSHHEPADQDRQSKGYEQVWRRIGLR